MSFYANMEKVIKEQGERGLIQLEHYYGLNMSLYRQTKHDAFARVHGRNAGGPEEFFKEIFGVVQGDDFLPSNDAHSGNFEAGFLYTREKDIKVGDTLEIGPRDGKSRRFKVDSNASFGFTLEIFTFWNLSALGD